MRISAEIFRDTFGATTDIYLNAKEELTALWDQVKRDPGVEAVMDYWVGAVRRLYGSEPGLSLFIDHVYLTLLAKIIVYLKLGATRSDNGEMLEVMSGQYFVNRGITNFVEQDYSVWIFNHSILDQSATLVLNLVRKLADYDFAKVDEDVFREIYEDITKRKERHKAGEYYTPEWLVELVLDNAFGSWEGRKGRVIPKILDPACGSGTFLYRAIKILGQKGKMQNIEDITENVTGIDVNPVATIIAKANYVMALSDFMTEFGQITIPIYNRDCLSAPPLFEHCAQIDKYDLIVGNPPWVVMRSMTNKEYQNFLKREVLRYQLLRSKEVHLFTQMELAALFFCKCADLYLRDGGLIAFVMPRSVIAGTTQHVNFRKFRNPPIKLVKIIDLQDVSPVFNMPSCVLIGIKCGITNYPVVMERYIGKLLSTNASLSEAKGRLGTEVGKYIPPDFSRPPSYYYHKFKVGASIFPRSLYFVDLVCDDSSRFPIRIKTSKKICEAAKVPWKSVLEGDIERDFLYSTLLASEMIPFGYGRLHAVALPIEQHLNGYRLLQGLDLQKGRSKGAAEWFGKAEEIWHKRRTEKSETRFPSLLDRLNYNNLLTSQSPSKRYAVLYNATGTNLVSCVIDKEWLPYFDIYPKRLKPQGFIVDVKTWCYETTNEMEAHYLSAILNSEGINKEIKPLQPRGLFGARAIHRRPLLLPIPGFEETNCLHLQLANLSKRCHEEIKSINFALGKNIRADARKKVANEMEQINRAVLKLLNSSNCLLEG